MISLIFVPLFSQYLRVIIFYPVMFIWIFTAMLIDKNWINRSFPEIMYLFYILILFVFAYLFSGSSDILRRYVTVIFISFSSLLLYTFYSENLHLISKYKSFILWSLIFGVTTTVYGVVKYPQAARILATDGSNYPELFEMFRKMGIGGYDFIYTLVVASIALIFLIKMVSGYRKIILAVAWILFEVCIFLSGYTIAILSSVLFCIFAFLLPVKSKKPNIHHVKISSIFLVGVAGLIVWFFRDPIFGLIATLADKLNVYYVSIRIKQLLSATEGEGLASLERIGLYKNAWLNFLDSPAFGIGIRKESLASGHSEVLYYLESFGVWGIVYLRKR